MSTTALAPQSTHSESSAQPTQASSASPGVQLKRTLAGHDYAVQMAQLTPVQRKEDTDAVHSAAARGVASGGGAMPYAGQIQASFGGHDIGNVQAHTGSEASAASAAMGAEAYATGNHVVFGGAPDLHTAAHEAAHVVQQQAGVSLSGGVGSAGDAYEQHADAVADAVVQGKSAEGLLSNMTGRGPVQQKVQRKVSRVQRKAVQRDTGNTTPSLTTVNVPGNNNSSREVTVNTGGGSMAENPQFEAHATEFERKLGPIAYGKAPPTLVALTGKVKQYILGKVQGQVESFKTLEEETKAILAKCAETREFYAGSAGADPQGLVEIMTSQQKAEGLLQTIEQGKQSGDNLMKADPPSQREQFIFIFNFCEKVLNEDLAATDLNQIAEAKQFASLDIAALQERRAFMEQRAKGRGGQMQAWDAQGYVPTPQGQMITASEGQETPPEALDSGAYNNQWNSRIHRGNTERAMGVDSNNVTSDRTSATSEQMAQNGMPLSQREQNLQPKGSNEALKWSEGKKLWIINEADKWVQAMRKLSLPVTAGPSGHTNGFMNAASMLGGVGMQEVRTVCIGQVLPINAHSLIEVLTAASAFGVPFTTGRQLYRSIGGFSGGELDLCKRDSPRGKLFPDEPDEVATNTPPPPTSGGAGANNGAGA